MKLAAQAPKCEGEYEEKCLRGALRVLGWGGSESGALKPQQKNIATKNYLGSDKKILNILKTTKC